MPIMNRLLPAARERGLFCLKGFYIVDEVGNPELYNTLVVEAHGLEHLAPDRHIARSVRHDGFVAVDVIHDSRLGELTRVLCGELSQVGRLFRERTGSGAIAFPGYSVANRAV